MFAIGYGKLVWRNRLVKREEGKDEEERIKVEELKRSGQNFEPRKSQDIPFGVRAIQSGIQVDGIWQSKDSTPIPGSLKLSHMRNNSSHLSKSQNASRVCLNVPQTTSSRGRSSEGPIESVTLLPVGKFKVEDIKAGEAKATRGHRPSYKPRRSSHLRYGSHGETTCNEDTLYQLEDKAVLELERSQRPSGTRDAVVEGDASSGAAADNERSSGSETDATLSSSIYLQPRFQCQPAPAQTSSRKPLPEQTKASLGRAPRASLLSQSLNAEYFAVRVGPPEHEKNNPFVSPVSSPMKAASSSFRPPYAQTARELTASGESQVPLLSISRSPSPFVPGKLHMNKAVRKVNSGFEILPAGTFGAPLNIQERGGDCGEQWKQDDDAGEKPDSNRLQKKIRTSMFSQRPPTAVESS